MKPTDPIRPAIEAQQGTKIGYDAVMFDLLTALIDSWSVWNKVAGSVEAGLRWRKEYLKLTYGTGRYRPYETLVSEAATSAGIPKKCAVDLVLRWNELTAWPEVPNVLRQIAGRSKLSIVTNCSKELGHRAAQQIFDGFDVIVTAEEAGFYKPRPEPYAMTLEMLGTAPERTLFVAGSASDVPGAAAFGMPVYWHNRIDLPAINEVSPDYLERSLNRLIEIV